MAVGSNLGDDIWVVDGTLDEIDFAGFSEDRFPLELALRALSEFSRPGDRVFDPFGGLGTTLSAAEQLGRIGLAIEANPERAAYLKKTFGSPHVVLAGKIQELDLDDIPVCSLVLTSPPYPTVNLADDPWGYTYFDDMREIFARVAKRIRPNGRIIVEVSNVRSEDGFRPLVAEFQQALAPVLRMEHQIIRLNRSGAMAGPGVGWSSLLIWSPRGE